MPSTTRSTASGRRPAAGRRRTAQRRAAQVEPLAGGPAQAPAQEPLLLLGARPLREPRPRLAVACAAAPSRCAPASPPGDPDAPCTAGNAPPRGPGRAGAPRWPGGCGPSRDPRSRAPWPAGAAAAPRSPPRSARSNLGGSASSSRTSSGRLHEVRRNATERSSSSVSTSCSETKRCWKPRSKAVYGESVSGARPCPLLWITRLCTAMGHSAAPPRRPCGSRPGTRRGRPAPPRPPSGTPRPRARAPLAAQGLRSSQSLRTSCGPAPAMAGGAL
jgi:hypothetical protein